MGYVRTAGLGQVSPQTQQIIGTAYGAGSGIATVALTTGASAPLAGAFGALTVPIVGAAFAGIFLGIEAILNSGCGQACIVTSNWANQAESLLRQNLDAYLALPVPRAASAQAAYLNNFDKVFAYLQQECGSPGLSTAGKNCIGDRDAGSCKWQTSAGGWVGSASSWSYVAPGPAGSGSDCWNWFVGYRDPIANDPFVVPDSQATLASGGTGLASIGGPRFLLLAAGVLIALGLVSGL